MRKRGCGILRVWLDWRALWLREFRTTFRNVVFAPRTTRPGPEHRKTWKELKAPPMKYGILSQEIPRNPNSSFDLFTCLSCLV